MVVLFTPSYPLPKTVYLEHVPDPFAAQPVTRPYIFILDDVILLKVTPQTPAVFHVHDPVDPLYTRLPPPFAYE